MSFPTRPNIFQSIQTHAHMQTNKHTPVFTISPFVLDLDHYHKTSQINHSRWCKCHEASHYGLLRRDEWVKHTPTHTNTHTYTYTKWELTTVKDLKAAGSYLTNLKVNDFSISLYPRLISVTEIGFVNSVTRMPAKCRDTMAFTSAFTAPVSLRGLNKSRHSLPLNLF